MLITIVYLYFVDAYHYEHGYNEVKDSPDDGKSQYRFPGNCSITRENASYLSRVRYRIYNSMLPQVTYHAPQLEATALFSPSPESIVRSVPCDCNLMRHASDRIKEILTKVGRLFFKYGEVVVYPIALPYAE